MSFFWVQMTVRNAGGDYVRMLVEAPFSTVRNFTDYLVENRIAACDKVWTIPDGAGGKVITGRESIGLGVGYVGMLQDVDFVPHEPTDQRG